MISALLEQKKLPALLSRRQMLDVLASEVYGVMPEVPRSMTFEAEKNIINNFCAGKAICDRVTITCTLNGGKFSFPVSVAIPADGKKHPFFVHINFRNAIPDLYQPSEELADNGFAVLSFCYKDVTSDDGDFTNGLSGVLYPRGIRESTSAGKIAMWAWAAQRVLDYAMTREELDSGCAVVCGHSRLGKAALLAAATDERFEFCYSNDSGCSGAAITRDKRGERVKDIFTRFPYWFCDRYGKYMDREAEMPFDQHYLLAAIAPRHVLVGSASEDIWADPVSEFLGCAAAGPAFEGGFSCPNRLPEIGETYFEGNIGYHLRKGLHYFSREDWQKLMAYVNMHKE